MTSSPTIESLAETVRVAIAELGYSPDMAGRGSCPGHPVGALLAGAVPGCEVAP